MDIPIEILWLFFALTAGLVAVGYFARFSVPISLFIFIAGGMLMALFVLTENITISNEIDIITTIPQNVTTFQNQTVITYAYFVESRGGTAGLNDIVHGIAELADTNSALIGDTINCIDLYLLRAGNPSNSTFAQIGVLDDTNSFIRLFGTQDPMQLTTASTWYSYCLSGNSTYTIQEGDRIGIKYTSGTATDLINVNHDSLNPFNSTNTVWSSYDDTTGLWTEVTGRDITGRFYLSETEPIELTFTGETANYEYTPNNYPFTEELKVFMLLISVIMILIGGAVEIEQRKR